MAKKWKPGYYWPIALAVLVVFVLGLTSQPLCAIGVVVGGIWLWAYLHKKNPSSKTRENVKGRRKSAEKKWDKSRKQSAKSSGSVKAGPYGVKKGRSK